MCLAIPGKIVSLKGDGVVVDYGKEKVEAKIIEGEYKEGDYVVVQGKIVIEKVPEKELKQWMELYK
ncbi:HypC/HybG/HupF family hydrogenase formation chaperone [Candidatus Woesearchaeota archaeon]|nr:HypC/HybG/HupF family hydrogenase formation chaperone [Candidatus Woesearchaeota archaeon]